MLLDPGSSFLEKYSGCPEISFELDEDKDKDMVIEEQSEKGGAGVKNKAFERSDAPIISRIGCEIPLSKGDGAMDDFHFSLRGDINKLGLKDLNPHYILQGEKFSPSRICSVGEIMGSDEIDTVVSDQVYQGLFSMEGHHSESGQEFKALAGDLDGLKQSHSQQKVFSSINFHSNFGFFGDVLQDNGPRMPHPQGYQHQIRSSGLDKFTAVDRNGKRSILHEVETQAQLMPSIPGVYFDRRQIGYRVRYHNSYVGWVALSRHSSIKDAYEYAKQLWLKARNKSNLGKCHAEQLEVGAAPGGILGGRGMGARKRVKQGVFEGGYQLTQKILCKPGLGGENCPYYDSTQAGSEHIFHDKYYGSGGDDFGVHPTAESEYAFAEGAMLKQPFEQEVPGELAKMSQYSALETMKKLYFATKEYMEKWPSLDGHHTIHWSNTSDLSFYLYGEDCEAENKRNFNARKPRTQRKIYVGLDKEKVGLEIPNIQDKKEIESFNYMW